MSRTNRLVPALAAPGLLLAALLGAWALQLGTVPVLSAQQGVGTLKALQSEREAIAAALTPAVVAVALERPVLSESRRTGLAMGGAIACSGFVVDGEFVITSAEAENLMPRVGRQMTGDFIQPSTKVWLMAHDGTEFSGVVVGTDLRNLLALVRMDPGHPELPSLKLGDSDAVAIGSTAMSLGNTLDSMLVDRVTSFSYGTVSGFYRFEPLDPLQPASANEHGDPYKGNVIEADVARLPGDDGGPLFNLDGEVIGMLNRHWMTGRHLACAVPSNQIRAVLPQLKKGVPQAELSTGHLGFKVEKPENDDRVFITTVEPGGPAARAGLKAGQQLTRVDNFPIPGIGRLQEMIGTKPIKFEREVPRTEFGEARRFMQHVSYGTPVGTHIQLTVRDAESGKERTVEIVVGEKPEDF